MELRDYLNILKKSWFLIFISILIFGFGGYISALKKVPLSQGIVTFYVFQKPEASTSYKYDNYYALSSTTIVIDQITGIILSPNTVLEVYQKNNANVPEQNFKKLAKIFQLQKNSPTANTLSVAVEAQSPEMAKNLAQTLTDTMLDTISQKQSDGQLSPNFIISSSNIDVVTNQLRPDIRALILAFVGAIVGISVSLAKRYLS